MKMLGLVAVIGFPSFYFVWQHLFPQPYENLPLRLACVAASAPLLFWHLLQRLPRRALRCYVFLLGTINIPFFFTFMLLMNGATPAWQMSLISSVIFLALLLDPLRMVVLHVVGSLLAIGAFTLNTSNSPLPLGYVETFPVQAFVLLGGALFNASWIRDQVERNRLKAVAAVAASVAHEIRTPLLAIQLDVDALRTGADSVASMSQDHAGGFLGAVDRISFQTRAASTLLDILLANSTRPEIRPNELQVLSMSDTLARALDQYPFRPDQRALMTVDVAQDFDYRGSDLLMRHVLFNLLKNSLRAIAGAGKGVISVHLEHGPRVNRLIFEDTGQGIGAAVLPHVTEPFFTTHCGDGGIGLGMSYCAQVMRCFGGEIAFDSKEGEFTRVTLSFPALERA